MADFRRLQEVIREGPPPVPPRFAVAVDPLVAARRFAAPTPEEAHMNLEATMREQWEETVPRNTFESFLRLLMPILLGIPSPLASPEARLRHELRREPTKQEVEKAQAQRALDLGLSFLTPTPLVAGIFAGKKGAAALGRLKQYEEASKAFEGGLRGPALWRAYGYEDVPHSPFAWPLSSPKPERFIWEISDEPAKLTLPGPAYRGRLAGVFQHPELYAAYPELQDIKVHVGVTPSGPLRGRADHERRIIEAFGPTKGDVEKILLHELNHIIQYLEGLPSGSNPSLAGSYDRYWRTAGEVASRNVEARFADPALRRFAPSLTEDVPRSAQIVAYRYPDWARTRR